jgi:hypothetical protein
VTLIVTINGPETIWLLADRRLSYPNKAPKDDARKVMFLQTTDGVAILGYAGLGSTARRTEPSDWMSAVLRGRNLPLDASLGMLADAMKRKLPRHLRQLSSPDHLVMAPAFVGNEATLYTIDLTLSPGDKSPVFNYRRWVAPPPAKAGSPPRFGITGSGAFQLQKDRNAKWAKELLRLVRANDCRKISPLAVADRLAQLNYAVHCKDSLVGPRCIVAWRHRRSYEGGGSHQFYNETKRESSSTALPTIVTGMDVTAICSVLMKHTPLEAMLADHPTQAPDENELNAELARLPDKPDENLS